MPSHSECDVPLRLVGCTALSLLVALLAHDLPSQKAPATKALSPIPEAVLGAKVPDFRLKDSLGQAWQLSEHKGRLIVVQWTSHACPTIRRYYDDGTMQKCRATVAGSDLVWVTVDSSAKAAASIASIAAWREEVGHDVPYLLDPSGEVGRRFGALATPHVFLIDGSSVLRYAGAIDDRDHEQPWLADAVAAVRSGEQVGVKKGALHGCTVKYAPRSPNGPIWRCPPCDHPCDELVFSTPGRCPECRMVLIRHIREPKHISDEARSLRAAASDASKNRNLAATLQALRECAAAGYPAIGDVLADEAFEALLSDPRARVQIRGLLERSASASDLTMVRVSEAGTRLALRIVVVDGEGRPIPRARLFLYHASAKGTYDPDSKNPRLFGWLTTSDKGEAEVRTVLPGSYPGTTVAPHIHFRLQPPGRQQVAGEIVFSGAGVLVGRARDEAMVFSAALEREADNLVSGSARIVVE